MNNSLFPLRVGIMGCPSRPRVAWTPENLAVLKELGFNAMQLNIAWGARPADEPLNLEDVIELPERCHHLDSSRYIPTLADPSPARREQRKADLRSRISLCRQAGMRTIFHFGAPNNGWGAPGFTEYMHGQLPRCLSDGKTADYYACLIEAFKEAYPGVDDLLVYTYDQAAWLCDEFGDCPHCRGVPLHKRVVPFINHLAETWQRLNPNGRLWWEPWELSAGQVLHCIEGLNPDCVGLSLHTNIAEAMATVVADRWFKNTAALAASRGIPVLGENFLGAASEELEPYTHLAHPLVTLRMLRSVSQVPGVQGIKEYYGLLPDQEDPNLRMTGLFLTTPALEESAYLARLAEPYGASAAKMVSFWRMTSEAMELFPWDASWFIREIGRSDPVHALSAAFLRGYCAETPSWLSTRDAIFMKVNNDEPHPWMLEDVQLRCDLAASRFQAALALGREILPALQGDLAASFASNLEELEGFVIRTHAYIYHIRATNLVSILRRLRSGGEEIPTRLIEELKIILHADQANMGVEEPLAQAIQMLDNDLDAFLAAYFHPSENQVSKGFFSLTSR